KLWQVPELKPKRLLGGEPFHACALAYSPDGKALAAAVSVERKGGYDNFLKLWAVQQGRELASFKGHEGCTTCLAFSRDGRVLYSGGWDGRVKVWDLKRGKERATFGPGVDPITFLDVSRDGKIVAVGFETTGVALYHGLAVGFTLHQ